MYHIAICDDDRATADYIASQVSVWAMYAMRNLTTVKDGLFPLSHRVGQSFLACSGGKTTTFCPGAA